MAKIRCPKCGHSFELNEENSDYTDLLQRVRTESFEQELAVRSEQAAQLAVAAERERAQEKAVGQQRDIDRLQALVDAADDKRESAVKIAVQETTAQMRDALDEARRQTFEAENAKQQALAEVERTAAHAKEKLAEQRRESELRLAERDAEIERIREMKARLNTKMLGETLEQHCELEFERLRATGFQNAYFAKDNEAVADADGAGKKSKGDYIYREKDADGCEVVSIMFEMKNQQEDAAGPQKKNSDHFAKLDRDRRKKDCEYAVLVSLLEPDNDLYNDGIVDVSFQSGFEKMYVIRPQFFIPFITLVRNMAYRSMAERRALAEARRQNLDITDFEEKLGAFTEGVSRDYTLAGKSFTEAVKSIDASIRGLEKVKERLLVTAKHLGAANNKASKVSVRTLTRGNETMQKRFAQLQEAAADLGEGVDLEKGAEPEESAG